jgi:signal transduction histidine kinase
VFDAFQQGQHDYEVSGTGLGLAISRHFVEAHGGKIWFDSEVGVGTTFHVTLPILGMEKQESTAKASQ